MMRLNNRYIMYAYVCVRGGDDTRMGSTANTRVMIDVGFLVREIFAVTA